MTTFSRTTVQKAWERQEGRCAACGKILAPTNHDRGSNGAWHAHHKKSKSYGINNSLGNCVLLCINPPDCHYNVGHKGNTRNRVVLSDADDLPYLYGDPRRFGLNNVKAPLNNVKPGLNNIRSFF